MPRSTLATLLLATLGPLTAACTANPPSVAASPGPEAALTPPTAPQPIAIPTAPVVPTPPITPTPPVIPTPPVAITPQPHAGPGAFLVYEHMLALSSDSDAEWATGEIRDHSGPGIAAASRAADPGLVPAELRALIDGPFTVYAADGSSCTARAGALSLYSRLDREPDYTDDEGNTREPTDAERRLLNASIVENAELLLAALVGDPPCDGLWARRADLPAPAVFAPVPLDEPATRALHKRLLPLLRSHPTVLTMAKEYRAFLRDLAREQREEARDAEESDAPAAAPPVQRPWPQFLRESLSVTRWDEIGGPRKLLNVVIGRDGDVCDDVFTNKVALLFTIEGEQLQLQPEPGFLTPHAVMDVERDGHLEAVVHYGRIETRGPNSFPTFDYDPIECPC